MAATHLSTRVEKECEQLTRLLTDFLEKKKPGSEPDVWATPRRDRETGKTTICLEIELTPKGEV